MSCVLFKHKCHTFVRIVYTLILYVYLWCLHIKIVHLIFMFKHHIMFVFELYEPMN